jgi:hypothetical protein
MIRESFRFRTSVLVLLCGPSRSILLYFEGTMMHGTRPLIYINMNIIFNIIIISSSSNVDA